MTSSNNLTSERPMDFLRRIVHWADVYNNDQSNLDLPSFPAIVEAHYLTTVIYGIDSI